MEQIREMLDRTRGNRAEAARRLDVSRTTLWRKIAEFGEELFPPEPPPDPGERPRPTKRS
jgi:DNA-binding NtrC family response regulator